MTLPYKHPHTWSFTQGFLLLSYCKGYLWHPSFPFLNSGMRGSSYIRQTPWKTAELSSFRRVSRRAGRARRAWPVSSKESVPLLGGSSGTQSQTCLPAWSRLPRTCPSPSGWAVLSSSFPFVPELPDFWCPQDSLSLFKYYAKTLLPPFYWCSGCVSGVSYFPPIFDNEVLTKKLVVGIHSLQS